MTAVVVLPDAENDLFAAQEWLTENASRNVALQLADEFIATTKRIAEHPEAFPVRENSTARYAVFARFRYSVYFEFDPISDRASITAMIHHSRSPEVVDERL